MSTERSLARLGGAAALVGTVLLFGATLLHPLGADPNDAPAAFAEYATDRLWVWTHLAQFLGFALLMAGLAAFGSTFASGAAAAWARIGVIGATATVAVAAALQAVDGVALKAMVDRWAAAAPDARAVAFETAFAVRQIEIGLASLLSLSAGLTLVVFGIAILASAAHPPWLGSLALLGGVGTVAGGALQAATGFSPAAMTVSSFASVALLVWAIVVGVLMWRTTPRGAAGAAPGGAAD